MLAGLIGPALAASVIWAGGELGPSSPWPQPSRIVRFAGLAGEIDWPPHVHPNAYLPRRDEPLTARDPLPPGPAGSGRIAVLVKPEIESQLRAVAARDLRCDSHRLALARRHRNVFEADGCGLSATYHCAESDGTLLCRQRPG